MYLAPLQVDQPSPQQPTMPATANLMNDTLMEVEHTPAVHKRVLDVMPGVSGGVARIMVGVQITVLQATTSLITTPLLCSARTACSMANCMSKMLENARIAHSEL
jgi:hypothetical protein